MINAIVFDVDGTLYNETDVKMMAELNTAEYLSQNSNIDVETIYTTFRKVKAQITNSDRGKPEANDRKRWYCEVISNLHIANVTMEEASDFYWQVIFDNMKPYTDLMCILPQLSQRYKLYVLTDELLEIHKQKLKCLGVDKFLKIQYQQNRQVQLNQVKDYLNMQLI